MALLAYIVALICFGIAALLGFGAFNGSHVLGWIAAGLFCSTIAGAYTVWTGPSGGVRL